MNAYAGAGTARSKSISAGLSKTHLTGLAMLFLAAGLLGCNGPSIRDISGVGVDAATNAETALEGTLGGVSKFTLTGSGVCGKIQVDFGDGTPPAVFTRYDFANPLIVTHTYSGWGGKKKVKAGSLVDCVGAPEVIFNVTPVPFKLALSAPLPAQCNTVPNKPDLPKNTQVHLTTWLAVATIVFGCTNCEYDQNGIAGLAPSDWPFPNFRPFSLVAKVGPDYYQGGTDATFITKQAGPLEVCVNESHLADQTGGWRVNIVVDESRAQ